MIPTDTVRYMVLFQEKVLQGYPQKYLPALLRCTAQGWAGTKQVSVFVHGGEGTM